MNKQSATQFLRYKTVLGLTESNLPKLLYGANLEIWLRSRADRPRRDTYDTKIKHQKHIEPETPHQVFAF